MSDIKNVFDIAARSMSAQMVRLNTVASNLANARSVASSEVEAYRAIKPVFKTIYADDLQKILKLSLEKLNQKNIYGLLIHRSTDLLKEGGEKLIRKLKELKEKDLVQKIGISIYDPKILSQIYKLFIPDIVQLPINVFNQESILEGYLDEMKEKNIEIHARSIFLQGLLLNSFEKLPNYFYEWKDLFFKWDYFCSSNNISKLEACINFALNIDLIDKLVLGFDDFNQFKESLLKF